MKPTHGSRSGFTVLEMMLSVGVFAVVGYGVAVAVKSGGTMQSTVVRVSNEGREMRGASLSLLDELQTSSDAHISALTQSDASTLLRFQQPVEDAGGLTWGVYDPAIGSTEADHNRVGWFLRYLVRTHSGVRQLVRQELDAAQAVQRESVVVEGLRSGHDSPPGFRVRKTGSIWEVTLSTDGVHGEEGIRTVFHVKTRN